MREKEKPMFKAQVILLDHHLFKLDAESWKASIMPHDGRWITLKFASWEVS
jgi:hypothetical protein